MKTTLELPDELVKDIKLRAIHEGKKLKDAVAELLRKGLAASGGVPATAVKKTAAQGGGTSAKMKASRAMLNRRKEMTRKFVSGEWGVEMAGFEQARKADRAKQRKLATAWRD